MAMMSPSTPSVWSPLSLGSKLKAWWAPLDGSNYTLNGSAIASWTDEVGGYVLAQATAASQPAYGATDWTGGLACAVFDGSNDSLVLDAIPGAIPTGSTPSEIWGQARSESADGTTDVLFDLGAAASGSPDRRTLARLTSTQAVVAYDGATASSVVTAVGDHIWRGVFGSDSARLDMDGVTGATTSGLTPTTGTARIRMGGSNFSTSQGPWRGAIRQVLITDALTSGEAANLLDYLNGGV
jgi:hypothetical protein